MDINDNKSVEQPEVNNETNNTAPVAKKRNNAVQKTKPASSELGKEIADKPAKKAAAKKTKAAPANEETSAIQNEVNNQQEATPVKKAVAKKAASKKGVKQTTEETSAGKNTDKSELQKEAKPKKAATAKKAAPKKKAPENIPVTETPAVTGDAALLADDVVEQAESTQTVTTEESPAAEIIIEEIEPVTVAETKNEAFVHRLEEATHAPSKTVLNKLTFFVRFYSKPGQNLFITAKHPLFGNDDPEQALPMQFYNADMWKAELPVSENFTMPVVYNYLLKEADGTFISDGGKDKIIDTHNYQSEEVTIIDSWNFEGYYENIFYTEPFKNVLFAHNTIQTEYAGPVTFSHTFKVKAPLLQEGQIVCMAGSADALSNWNADKLVMLHKKADEDYWSVEVDLSEAQFPVNYKYGVYDVRKQQFVRVEDGSNRTLDNTLGENNKTIVNDGFIVLPDNTWKGSGVAIPVFSLRSQHSFGTGEFTDIKALVDWSKQIGLKLIQLLPVNDTTATETWQDSYPYAAISTFALHPMYINIDEAVQEENKHFVEQFDEERKRLNKLSSLDYEAVNSIKWQIIHAVYPLQKDALFSTAEYQQFFESNKHWLIPYAIFCCLRDKYKTADYTKWQEHKNYNQSEVDRLSQSDRYRNTAEMYYFVQYYLHQQLQDATAYAHANGIIVKGDIAIGIARNSVDTWQQPKLFNLNMQAGAPPDDFAVKGQNWSFPTYNWQQMKQDGFAWWKQRFAQMSSYFDAFRIDHILGFFRIWSIPANAVEGIMGHFVQAIPVHISEFHQHNIWFDRNRYTKPFINDQVLSDSFGDQQEFVRNNFLNYEDGLYSLKPEVATQRRVETYFSIRETNGHNQWLKQTLFDLISNVILFEEENSNGQYFHFRFGMENTLSYKYLDAHTQYQLRELSINYFYDRQSDFWYHQAMQKLPALKKETNMLICGEDLGMVPASVPQAMHNLGLLSLEVQRMPKDEQATFTYLDHVPYLSVATPSTHDMSTIRAWWEEDRNTTQQFYNQVLGQQGEAPIFCEPWICKMIIDQHLQSPAMWSIFQLQDLLSVDGSLRRQNPYEERINEPAIPKFYWQYRMHILLDDLINAADLNNQLKQSITSANR